MLVRQIAFAVTLAFAAAGVPAVFAAETPCELNGTVKSVKSGNWSDVATWGGSLPKATDLVNVGTNHAVVFDLPTARVAGITVNCGGTLAFDAGKNGTLETSKNVVVAGNLRMRPASAAQTHILRFVDVNEQAYVGGGMDVLDSDVGLWVMNQGVLDLQGTKKTSWANVAGVIAAGAGSIQMKAAPEGWAVGDEIAIAPTEAPAYIAGDRLLGGTIDTTGFDKTLMQFEETQIKSISGAAVELAKTVSRARPLVNGKWTAEVMNFTRNVRVEGTALGRAHIFIHAQKRQNIKYVAVRHMGPRKGQKGIINGEYRRGELVLGRYAVHFHHAMEGSRGTVVEGNVVRDVGTRGYVPHVSHGITLKDNVAYNLEDKAYWWDEGEASHDSLWVGNIAAKIAREVFSQAAYVLGAGENNIARNNVAVGIDAADAHNMAAYFWSANNEGVWVFENNLAHNNGSALNVWQNSGRPHNIDHFVAYHNVIGIFHGAYINEYTYTSINLYGNMLGFEVHAAAGQGQSINNCIVDSAGVADYGMAMVGSPVASGRPIMIRNCRIVGHRKAGVYHAVNTEFFKGADLVHNEISKPDLVFAGDVNPQEYVRIQPAQGPCHVYRRTQGTTFVAEHGAYRTEIPCFAPKVWGTGLGLKGEYFQGANFEKLVATKLDFMLLFDNWGSDGADPKLPIAGPYSVRWTGKIMFQHSEPVRFMANLGGALRCWVGPTALSWRREESGQPTNAYQERYPEPVIADPINVTAGQLYDFKCEYFNLDARSLVVLRWESPSQKRTIVVQSQFYPPAGFYDNPGADVPPANVAPTANAGNDQTITLPVATAQLAGVANDPDGQIASYAWTKKTGPAAGTIVSPNAASTALTGLVEGTYTFLLTATDNGGAKGYDEVNVVVKPAVPANKPPVVNAGADVTLTLPVNAANLTATASDSDGTIAKVEWTTLVGPATKSVAGANTATLRLSGLVEGTYAFRVTVTDNQGATAQDDVTVVVKAAVPPNPNPTPSATPSPTPSVQPPACSRAGWQLFRCDGRTQRILRVYVK